MNKASDQLPPSLTGARRMRVLSVVSSSNQMYSGIGRNLFELARRMTNRIAFEFAIDDANLRNTELVVKFAAEIEAPVHIGRASWRPDALDAGNLDLPTLLTRNRFDLVECVCFANTATNAAVLDHLESHVPLVYTPHDQPLWTIPTNPQQASHIADVHTRMVHRSNATLCDSPVERRQIQALAPTQNNAFFLPLGCDFSHFQPGPASTRREQLLFVGDLAEPRKRFDRVLDVLARLRADRPRLTLLVIGNRGEEFRDRIPPALHEAVVIRGYVNESELKRAYAESAGLVLLSDYEAFGMPILEALASRTPVFLNEIPACWSLFGIYQGATFCPGGDPDTTAARIATALDLGPHLIDAMKQDEYHLRHTFGWQHLARKKWELLAAAWHRRTGFALPA